MTMKKLKFILIATTAFGVVSCGLFNSSVPLPSQVAGLKSIGGVNSVYVNGRSSVRHAYSVAARGDTLLVIGDNAVYYILPGQSMQKLNTTWQYFNTNQNVWDFAYDSTFPGEYAGFVGDPDSLYISDWWVSQCLSSEYAGIVNIDQ